MRKERFPNAKKSKLDARGDGPFRVLKKINDNAYQIELPGEYGVSATFNVVDLSPYDFDEEMSDSRTNPFKKGENDSTQEVDRTKLIDGRPGVMTRRKAKRLKR